MNRKTKLFESLVLSTVKGQPLKEIHYFYENTDILSSPDLVIQMVLCDFDTVERGRTGGSMKINTTKNKFYCPKCKYIQVINFTMLYACV